MEANVVLVTGAALILITILGLIGGQRGWSKRLERRLQSLEGKAGGLPTNQLTRESREVFFAADLMAQTLTMVHLVFHGLFIAALAQLLGAGVQTLPTRYLVTLLSLLGAALSVLAGFREQRQNAVRAWWEGHYGQGAVFEGMRDALPYGWVRHSRFLIMMALVFVYVGIFLYAWMV